MIMIKAFFVPILIGLTLGNVFGAGPETIPTDSLKTFSAGVYREYLRSLNETYGEYNHETLKRHPEIADAILRVKPDFRKKDIATAFPNAFFKSKDGRILLILRGCTPHDCAGTVHIIAYDTLTRKAYVLREKYDGEAVQIYGAPDQIIRQVLINVYLD